MNIIQIVAIDHSLGIGKNGNLLFKNKYDMNLFTRFTKEVCPVVICGRKTLESLPNKELKDRDIIVLTRDTKYETKHKIAHSVEEAIKLAETCDRYNGNVGIIGGGEIYEQFLPYSNFLLITKFLACGFADTFYPNFNLYREILHIPFPNNGALCNLSLYIDTYREYEDRLLVLDIFNKLSVIIKDISESANKKDIQNMDSL